MLQQLLSRENPIKMIQENRKHQCKPIETRTDPHGKVGIREAMTRSLN